MKENTETFSRYLSEMTVNELKESTLDTDRLAVGKLMTFLGSKPFKEASREDMLEFFAAVTPRYKPSYVHLIKRRIKHFYNWLFNLEHGEYPPCVRWLRSYNPRHGTKTKGEDTTIDPQLVLKDEDVLKLIGAADHPRDAAIVSLLFETGAEACELLALKVGSVMFDQLGAQVCLEGTGGRRIIRIVDSVGYIQNWINYHPAKTDKTAPLWVVRGKKIKAMSYSNLYRLLQKLKDITGLDKPCSPKWFRHSALTRMAKVLPEQLLKKFAGWQPDSPMAKIYVHLAAADLDNALIQAHGEKPPKPIKLDQSVLKPTECPRCSFKIEPSWSFCPRCSLSFLRGTKASWDDIVQRLWGDDEAIKWLVERYNLNPKLAESPTPEELAKRFRKTQKTDKP